MPWFRLGWVDGGSGVVGFVGRYWEVLRNALFVLHCVDESPA